MKYITKKLYRLDLPINHSSIIIDTRANEFSEEFYNEIYNIRKKEWIEENDFLTSYDKFKEYTIMSESDVNVHSDESLKLRYEECKKSTLNGLPLSDAFDFNQKHLINDLKTNLPSNILDQVKDIRVLALGYVSGSVYNSIKEMTDKNLEEAYNEYFKIEQQLLKNDSNEFIINGFTYCHILSCKPNHNDLELEINNYEFNEEITIIFKNYSIILDENIVDTEWVCKEVYKIDGIYEVHILTEDENDLRELIVRCEDIFLE